MLILVSNDLRGSHGKVGVLVREYILKVVCGEPVRNATACRLGLDGIRLTQRFRFVGMVAFLELKY